MYPDRQHTQYHQEGLELQRLETEQTVTMEHPLRRKEVAMEVQDLQMMQLLLV